MMRMMMTMIKEEEEEEEERWGVGDTAVGRWDEGGEEGGGGGNSFAVLNQTKFVPAFPFNVRETMKETLKVRQSLSVRDRKHLVSYRFILSLI